MPYSIDKKTKCIYKKNPDGSRGKKVGCTKGSLKKYLKALQTNVRKNMKLKLNETPTPKFKKGDIVNYIPKLGGLNPNKKLKISGMRYSEGDDFTTPGWYYSFDNINLSSAEKDIKLASKSNTTESVKQLIKRIVKEEIDKNKVTLATLYPNTSNPTFSLALRSLFVVPTSDKTAIEINVVPIDEKSVSAIQTKGETLVKWLNSTKTQEEIIDKYNEKYGTNIEYIDDMYNTIKSIKYHIN